MSQDPHTGTSDHRRDMVHGFGIPFTAMIDPQPSVNVSASPGTVRLALELLERTAGPQRRRRRCMSVIAENARERGQRRRLDG